MLRHREIAASPARTAAATWTAITDLVAITLDRSNTIDGTAVQREFEAMAPAGRALVAAGHLDREQLTLVAPPLHLTVGTVSGEQALRELDEENANPVPGAATATTWTVYLPRPDGLATLIDDVIAGLDHVSTDSPPASDQDNAAPSKSNIDLGRLDPSRRN